MFMRPVRGLGQPEVGRTDFMQTFAFAADKWNETTTAFDLFRQEALPCLFSIVGDPHPKPRLFQQQAACPGRPGFESVLRRRLAGRAVDDRLPARKRISLEEGKTLANDHSAVRSWCPCRA